MAVKQQSNVIPYNFVLVDATPLLLKYAQKFETLKTSDNKKSGAIFGYIRGIFKLLKNHHPFYLAHVFEVTSELKNSEFYYQFVELQKLIEDLGLGRFFITHDCMETTSLLCDRASIINTFKTLIVSDNEKATSLMKDQIHRLKNKKVDNSQGDISYFRWRFDEFEDCLITLEHKLASNPHMIREALQKWEMKTIMKQLNMVPS